MAISMICGRKSPISVKGAVKLFLVKLKLNYVAVPLCLTYFDDGALQPPVSMLAVSSMAPPKREPLVAN